MTSRGRNSINQELRRKQKNAPDSRSQSAVLFDFLEGRTELPKTLRELKTRGAMGLLWAGELCLEQAYAESDPDTASYHFSVADKYLLQSIQTRTKHSEFDIDRSIGRAQLQRAYLPAHQLLAVKKQLLSSRVADEIYTKTIEIGMGLAAAHRREDATTGSEGAREFTGTIGQVAALALFERFAVKEIGADSWYPFPSNISEARRNGLMPEDRVNHAWNVSVWTDNDGDPSLDYRIEVRNSQNSVGAKVTDSDEVGISTVYLDPNIRLSAGEFFPGRIAIEECHMELTDPDSSVDISARLDERTAKLLQAINYGMAA